MEQADVGGLVPRPDPIAPSPLAVHLGQRFAERQHAVVAGKIEGADRRGIADRAMVGVVEEQREASTSPAQRTDRRDERRLVPFVDDDELGIADQNFCLGIGGVAFRRKLRIRGAKGVEPGVPVIGAKVRQAPIAYGLQRADIMPARHQLAQHAAQEMRVAVVPARQQGMREIDDLHAAAFRVTCVARACA